MRKVTDHIMRIGIDMRMAGTGEGIARYVEELVRHLAAIDTKNEYALLLHEGAISKFKIQNSKFRKVLIKSRYYSFAEQTKFIWELRRLKLDLVHFPSFNLPIWYPGKFIVTIHDLIHHTFPGKKKSRFFQRAAYRLVIWAAIKRAQKVLTVSQATKAQLLKYFRILPQKIEVIYEGVDETFSRQQESRKIEAVKGKYGITKPYLLFVGVWRRYKNLPRLAQAFDILKEKYGKDVELVLAGKIDPFYPEIKPKVLEIRHGRDIKILGFVEDQDLIGLYQGAKIFVLPSLIEGFGLIAVEAQASGVPVVASNIGVLEEVLGKGAIYFDPLSPEDMAGKINLILSDSVSAQQLVKLGKENALKYNWDDAAKKTLAIYKNAGKRN